MPNFSSLAGLEVAEKFVVVGGVVVVVEHVIVCMYVCILLLT